jgi:two-component system LytT family sensor kinase
MGHRGRTSLERSLRLLPILNTQAQTHLLANALSLVGSLARRRPDAAEDLLAYVAGYLRAQLAPWRPMVRLSDELRTVLTFVGVERARLGSRLRLEVAVAPDALNALVPPLALQPLVENAVQHGATRRRTGGCVRISARVNAGRLLVAVADDGPGLRRRTGGAGAGTAADGIAGETSAGGWGLTCLRLRLEALWGAAARLRVLTRPDGGVLAAISLPATFGREMTPPTAGAACPPQDRRR